MSRTRLTRALLIGLLAALLLQEALSMRLLSATFDETTHLPAGYTYLTTGDFRLNPQHPPLVKLIAAAPLMLVGPELNLDDPAWRRDPPNEWEFGYRFLYGNEADRLLFWGRLPIALLSLLMAFYLFRWARDLFGEAAGLAAVTLCAFSPTVIAHARLVTFDVGLACFSTMALYHLWRHARGGEWAHLFLAGAGLGLALASKFSALVLLAAFVPLALWAGLRVSSLRAVAGVAVPVVTAALVVWASYFFSTDAFSIYWEGVERVNADHDPGYRFYLMGEFREGGFWYYFPVAFLLKTPVPILLLLVLAVVLARRFAAADRIDEAFLALPAVAFAIATIALADNMGVRYLLPLYPLIFVFVSRLARALPARKWSRWAAGLLALWYVGGAVAIYPDHLAYFNELAGGPARGHRYLDDSNLDWGQDLKRLKRYLDRHGIETIKLRYGPHVAPDYYGIRWEPITDAEWAGEPGPGIYAFGAHLLIRGELYAAEQGVKTDWLSRYEPIGRVGYSLYLFEFD